MSRKIQAPGIELRAYDRSGYDQTQDYSIVGTTSLIAGVADEGEDYTIQWVNSKQTLKSLYGTPKNEAEMYFYNAGTEILNKGGVCLMAKLPYNNEAKDKFNSVTYKFDDLVTEIPESLTLPYSELRALDSYLTSYISISQKPTSEKISIQDLDILMTGNKAAANNKITIVDITRSKYAKSNDINSFVKHQDAQSTADFLGIVPLIVTPTNALYFQNSQNSLFKNTEISNYNVISSLTTVSHNNITFDSFGVLSTLTQPLTSDFKTEDFSPTESYSKDSVNYFPNINFVDSSHLDTTHLKDIGIVVFKAYKNDANDIYTTLAVVESFVGSIDPAAKDENSNASRFIDDIVNNNSQYIKVFSQANSTLLEKAKTVLINNQTAVSLGFYDIDLTKNISYSETILKPLNIILERAKDKNLMNVDLVIDAGTSTLAQLAAAKDGSVTFTNEKWRICDVDHNDNDPKSTYLDFSDINIKSWKTVLQKYDTFCKLTRKDCVFIADGLRQFCLNGNSKLVRSTKLNSSVEIDILPNLKYMTGLNSSYSTGYSNWFQISDEFSGEYFWCPPSIKAAGVYTYTDAYYHKWDAPAGMIRGKINTAIDCAFSPNIDEAGRIYTQAWNYAVSYPLDGIILEGQKTFQIKKTAFDRVNVRRLFLYLEKSVVRIAKYFLYQGNTAYLRQRLVDTIKPIFEDAVNGQGILEYLIKCDDTNNTPQTIDNNELHCQIAVKPVKTTEFIVLDFICTNQSATVNEQVFNTIN